MDEACEEGRHQTWRTVHLPSVQDEREARGPLNNWSLDQLCHRYHAPIRPSPAALDHEGPRHALPAFTINKPYFRLGINNWQGKFFLELFK